MKKLIISDFLKLIYGKYHIYTLISVLSIFIFYCFVGDATLFSSGNPYNLGEGIGFISNIYLDKSNIEFGYILRNIMFSNGIIWIVILFFSSSFFLYEYNCNTIKLTISYGYDKFRIYLSKVIVISIWSLILYYLIAILILIHSINVLRFTITLMDIIEFIKMSIIIFLVIEVFIIITLMLCILFKNSMWVNFIMSLIMVSLPLVYMMVWNKMEKQSILINLFVKLNPMYYLATISAYNFKNNIIFNSIIYSLLGIYLLIGCSKFILNRSEIK